MTNLSDKLKEEILNLCKQIPENFQFTLSLLQEKTHAKLGIDTILSFYDMCNKFLTLAELYETSNPNIQQQQEFQELKNQITEYKSDIRKYLLDIFK